MRETIEVRLNDYKMLKRACLDTNMDKLKEWAEFMIRNADRDLAIKMASSDNAAQAITRHVPLSVADPVISSEE